MSPRVAVVGAGWLGALVAAELAAAGREVIATTRSGQWREGDPPPGVRVAGLDVCDAGLQTEALADAETIVIGVAPGGDQDREALYVAGVRRLIERRPAGARVIFLGSTSALPDVDGWVFEDEPAWPDRPRGQVQRRAEQAVHDADPDALVLRLGGLIGPGRALERIARLGKASPRDGDGMTATNLLHRDDAAAAVLAAIARPSVRGIVHVVCDAHPPRRTLYAEVADRIGAPPIDWREPPQTRHPRGKRVSNLRMKAQLGIRLRHPAPR